MGPTQAIIYSLGKDQAKKMAKGSKAGSGDDWASARGWALRCILKQFQEMYDDPVVLARCLDKASCTR